MSQTIAMPHSTKAATSAANSPSTPQFNLFAVTAASRCARHIADSYQRYRTQHRQLSHQAALHFQQCDWSAARMDAAESHGLFDQFAQRAAAALTHVMDDMASKPTGNELSRHFWSAVSLQYAAMLAADHDQIAARLFFARTQTLCPPRMQGGAPSEAMIFRLPPDAHHAELHYSPCDRSLADTLQPLLSSLAMETEWQDLASSAQHIATALQSTLHAHDWHAQDIELLTTVFYRGTRAYLIGCLQHQQGQLPMIVVLRNDGEGACVDEVLLGSAASANLFRTGQHVLQADSPDLSAALGYVHSLLPELSWAQLACSVGWPTITRMPCN